MKTLCGWEQGGFIHRLHRFSQIAEPDSRVGWSRGWALINTLALLPDFRCLLINIAGWLADIAPVLVNKRRLLISIDALLVNMAGLLTDIGRSLMNIAGLLTDIRPLLINIRLSLINIDALLINMPALLTDIGAMSVNKRGHQTSGLRHKRLKCCRLTDLRQSRG